MLNKDLEISLNSAFKQAEEDLSEYITVEHLLLALLDNFTAKAALEACGADVNKIRLALQLFLNGIPKLKLSDRLARIEPTIGFQRVLQRAISHAQSALLDEINGANILAAIFSEPESQAVYILRQNGVNRLDIISFISHGLEKQHFNPDFEYDEQLDDEDTQETQQAADPLANFTYNLNEQAAQGHIDPLIGREAEIERTIQILCRRRKNNPLLVGEAGVGKTAIAEGLAYRIIHNQVPNIIANATVYALDLGALLAGTKYRGDFEQRLKVLLKKITADKNIILFIDEIHSIIGAGSTSEGIMDASNLLKPYLSNGSMRCIGATTFQEFQSVFEKDRALARRFQKIDINEPSIAETIKILQGLKEKYESHHKVRYSTAALIAATELSAKYINNKYLPDKAIDVIDEAGAFMAIKANNNRKKNIGLHEIETIVAKIARIPEKSINASDRETLQFLERNLKLSIFGQDQAITSVSAAIRLARSGLANENKPIGSFLFAGPTGVGKTEVANQLAIHMGLKLIRFDMSEYMEQHTVSRLIGAPPGYVGYDQGGLLTDAVIKTPHCIVLLDEIEKAHPQVYNLLLQVMDHGTLTDNNGRKANFRNTILIMTSNAGVHEINRKSMGFSIQDHTQDALIEINKVFSPEFRNRLDAIVWFNHLNEQIIINVIDKFLRDLQRQLDAKKVNLVVTTQARAWLAKKGYDRTMGARPMARVITEFIKRPLADEILFGKLNKGGTATVDTLNNDITINCQAF